MYSNSGGVTLLQNAPFVVALIPIRGTSIAKKSSEQMVYPILSIIQTHAVSHSLNIPKVNTKGQYMEGCQEQG